MNNSEILECMKALEKMVDVVKDLLDWADVLEGCDCGGAGICPICNALEILHDIEEDFGL